MKVSLNWIKEFTQVDATVDELVEKIGAQLGAVEEVLDLGKRYQGVVVAKVVSCVEHSNSDHLHVCKIDDGGRVQNVERDENGHVQVVCGAPNVRAGLLVAWLPPGATVPESFETEPFILETRDIRGQTSNGMLASARELALGDNHEGILEVDQAAQPGDDFAAVYKLDDYIIDIENKMFTHRPDCFGMLGVAREIAGIQEREFTSPEWYVNPTAPPNAQSEAVKGLTVDVQIPDLCPRYMALVIDDVLVKPSPLWLQTYLMRVGIRPINNIVDMTNYMMVVTGQPLHAFDFDKVAKDGVASIVVRKPHEGEKMTLLDGKEITPRAHAILICDTDKPIALGGVMGGNNSEIDENTKRIIIECANFDMYNIRRTSMEHGIFTDAVTRFTKGQSSWQCPAVLYKAVQLTQELVAEAQSIGEPVDVHYVARKNEPVAVSADFINARLGESLPAADMQRLLTNVEFAVKAENDNLEVLAPFWRTDIEIAEDVVEEVGRLYGFDHLQLELPHRSITPTAQDALLELKSRMRTALARAGANEVLTYSFVHGDLLGKVGQDASQAFQLSNALSPELQYYRLSLTPSLLDKVHPNIKAGYDEFALFEIGKGHNIGHVDDEGLPKEVEKTALVLASKMKRGTVQGAAYFAARKYLDCLAAELGLELRYEILTEEADYQTAKPFDYQRSAHVVEQTSGTVIGIVGEFKRPVSRALKLPQACAGFELSTAKLLPLIRATKAYTPLSRYPKIEQDISLKIPASLAYAELFSMLQRQIESLRPPKTIFSLRPLDIYQGREDEEHKHVTLRLSIASYEKTMRDAEVNELLDQAAAVAQQEFGAERL